MDYKNVIIGNIKKSTPDKALLHELEVNFMKKSFMTFVAIIIAITTVLGTNGLEVKAYEKCGYKGCSAENTPNGTVFCDKHAGQYAREEGYDYCDYPSCWGHVAKDSDYCSLHTCANTKCTNKVESGSRYCSTHTESTTTKKSSSSSYSTKKSSSSKSSSKYSSSKSNKKKYDTYDVYNYKSAQEFADDKYEEFYDYEDDYDDEDEAYDAAEDYWYDHH